MYTSTVLQYRVYMVCSTRSRPPSGTSLNVNLQKMNVISVTVGPLWRRVRLVVRSVDFSAFAVVRDSYVRRFTYYCVADCEIGRAHV